MSLKTSLITIIVGALIVYGIVLWERSSGDGVPTESETIMETDLKIETLSEGSGAETKSGNTITVHYTGTLVDGSKFDSSVDRGVPFSFVLGTGAVIAGWDQGLLGMKVGEKRRLTIPSDLAYGPSGRPPVIPPSATLIFEVELLAIE